MLSSRGATSITSHRIMTVSNVQNESIDKAMTLEELSDIYGAGFKNEYAKLNKPKAPKEAV